MRGGLSVALDRELEEEKSHDPSGPRIRCPLCGWSPREDDRWSCTCGNEWNTFEQNCAIRLRRQRYRYVRRLEGTYA